MRCGKVLLFSLCCALGFAKAPAPPPEEQKPYKPHLSIEGDVLCWTPQVSGLDNNFGSGSSLQTTVNGVTTTYSTEIDVDPPSQWNAGYRIALGWQFDPAPWQLAGVWTDFQGSAKKTANHGKWEVHLCQLDLAASYDICFSSVHLQPLIGLRGTSILQKLSSEVITQVVYPSSGTSTDTRIFRDREQFRAIGPLFGFNSLYPIKYGLSVFGNFAFGLLYGQYQLRFNDNEAITPPATAQQIYSIIKKTMHSFDFDLDLALGIQWERLIRDTYHAIFKLSLENHQYFNQSRLGHTFGNVSFSGAAFSFGITF